MKKSYYFAELASSYDAEIQDLLSDSEGKPVLKTRLMEKRRELKSILPMIEFSPEMVVPVFYDSFCFANPKAMAAAVRCEPDDGDFPAWDDFSSIVTVEPWASAYLAAVLADRAGEAFMVTAACLEFIRKFDGRPDLAAADEDESGEAKGEGDEAGDDSDEAGDDEGRDLAEAGDAWLGEQGFDSLKS